MGDPVELTSISPGSFVPLPAGLDIPATTARLQLNSVPGVPLVGVYEKIPPLHIAGGVNELVNTGMGLTTTTTLKVVGFVHPLAESE
jgi:hypothetical protein